MSLTAPDPDHLQRVAVLGSTGSGKTTFARRLAALLDAPHVQLDAIHWLPDWRERDGDDFLARVAERVAEDRWVIDGNYRKARDRVWPRATALIWLDYPFTTTFARLLRRTVGRIRDQQELFSGNRETWRGFFSRDSILIWLFRSYGRHRREYGEVFSGRTWSQAVRIHLAAPAEAEVFLEDLARRLDRKLQPPR